MRRLRVLWGKIDWIMAIPMAIMAVLIGMAFLGILYGTDSTQSETLTTPWAD